MYYIMTAKDISTRKMPFTTIMKVLCIRKGA